MAAVGAYACRSVLYAVPSECVKKTGGLGVEPQLASFVVSAALFAEIDLAELGPLDALAFDGYLAGLQDAGWQARPELARLGYTVAATMRYGIGTIWLMPSFLDPQHRG